MVSTEDKELKLKFLLANQSMFYSEVRFVK